MVGAAAFLHESGIHCAGQLRDERSYEVYSPAIVGRERPAFILGSHTGGASVAAALNAQGVQISTEAARRVAARVRELSAHRGRPLSAAELSGLLNESAA